MKIPYVVGQWLRVRTDKDFALSHEDGAELMAQKIERRFGGGATIAAKIRKGE